MKASPDETSSNNVNGVVRESLASLPGKPWKSQCGNVVTTGVVGFTRSPNDQGILANPTTSPDSYFTLDAK